MHHDTLATLVVIIVSGGAGAIGSALWITALLRSVEKKRERN